MIYLQRQTYRPQQPTPQTQTGPFKSRLTGAGARLLTAVLAKENCFVQSEEAPLRYRLLSDTALRLAEMNQAAAYFDLTSLAYQYSLATWVQNNISLLAVQLNLPLPDKQWGKVSQTCDPLDYFILYLEEQVLENTSGLVVLSFDEADELDRAPLAADFYRLLGIICQAQVNRTDFARLAVVLWGQTAWEHLLKDDRLPKDAFRQITL